MFILYGLGYLRLVISLVFWSPPTSLPVEVDVGGLLLLGLFSDDLEWHRWLSWPLIPGSRCRSRRIGPVNRCFFND